MGVILLGVGVITTSFLVQKTSILRGFATNSTTPTNIRITNITESSFSVSYTTTDEVIGSLIYGANEQMESAASDVQDATGQPANHRTHFFTVTNLQPQTTYYFSVVSGGTTYKNDAVPYEVQTGPPLATTAPTQQITGKILLPTGENGNNVLVYLTTDSSQMLGTLTGNEGQFSFATGSLRTKELTALASITDTTVFSLLINGSPEEATVNFLKNQSNPLPVITLSHDYDFTTTTDPIQLSSEASTSARSKFPVFVAAPVAKNQEVKILTPADEQGIHDQKPVFRGTAKPNETIEIEIHSAEAIQAQVTSDGRGGWSYRPSQSLTPGEHTITIKTRTASGILKSITQKFTVFAEGSQFTQPSVSPVQPSVATTLTPTTAAPTPTTKPISNSVTVVPTILPTIATTPVVLISPTAIILLTAPETLPATGDPLIVYSVIIAGTCMSTLGILLLLTKKTIFT